MPRLQKRLRVFSAWWARPVIIALGHELDPQGPFEISLGFNGIFEYSPESLQEFAARTVRLAFLDRATGDEKYVVHLLRG